MRWQVVMGARKDDEESRALQAIKNVHSFQAVRRIGVSLAFARGPRGET